jgi:hypothetical protein
MAGEIPELGRRAAEWLREATQRGGRYAQMVASQSLALYSLASGDVAATRRLAHANLEAWSSYGYTVQHHYAMWFDALCDLYEGRPADADGRLRRAWPDIERAGMLQMSMTRIEILVLRATIDLGLAAGMWWGRSRLLRSCRRIAARLAREKRADGPPHADLLRAAVAAALGESTAAHAWLDRSIEGFSRAGMSVAARAAQRKKGELAGDRSVIHDADLWMTGRGIRDPERWALLYGPPMRGSHQNRA